MGQQESHISSSETHNGESTDAIALGKDHLYRETGLPVPLGDNRPVPELVRQTPRSLDTSHDHGHSFTGSDRPISPPKLRRVFLPSGTDPLETTLQPLEGDDPSHHASKRQIMKASTPSEVATLDLRDASAHVTMLPSSPPVADDDYRRSVSLNHDRARFNSTASKPTRPQTNIPSYSAPDAVAQAKRGPYIFISSAHLPANLHFVRHLQGFFRYWKPRYTLLDQSGFYITFQDTFAGREQMRQARKARNGEKLFDQYRLVLQLYNDGSTMRKDSTSIDQQGSRTASVEHPREDDTEPQYSPLANHNVNNRPGPLSLASTYPRDESERDTASTYASATPLSDAPHQHRKTCHVCKDESVFAMKGLVRCAKCPRRFHERCHPKPRPADLEILARKGNVLVGFDQEGWSCRRCIAKAAEKSETFPDELVTLPTDALEDPSIKLRTDKENIAPSPTSANEVLPANGFPRHSDKLHIENLEPTETLEPPRKKFRQDSGFRGQSDTHIATTSLAPASPLVLPSLTEVEGLSDAHSTVVDRPQHNDNGQRSAYQRLRTAHEDGDLQQTSTQDDVALDEAVQLVETSFSPTKDSTAKQADTSRSKGWNFIRRKQYLEPVEPANEPAASSEHRGDRVDHVERGKTIDLQSDKVVPPSTMPDKPPSVLEIPESPDDERRGCETLSVTTHPGIVGQQPSQPVPALTPRNLSLEANQTAYTHNSSLSNTPGCEQSEMPTTSREFSALHDIVGKVKKARKPTPVIIQTCERCNARMAGDPSGLRKLCVSCKRGQQTSKELDSISSMPANTLVDVSEVRVPSSTITSPLKVPSRAVQTDHDSIAQEHRPVETDRNAPPQSELDAHHGLPIPLPNTNSSSARDKLPERVIGANTGGANDKEEPLTQASMHLNDVSMISPRTDASQYTPQEESISLDHAHAAPQEDRSLLQEVPSDHLEKIRASFGDTDRQPHGALVKLIGMALCAAPNHRLQANGIARWIIQNIPTFDHGIWEKNISAFLSLNRVGAPNSTKSLWEKTEQREGEVGDGKGSWWQLMPGVEETLMQWDPVLKEPVEPIRKSEKVTKVKAKASCDQTKKARAGGTLVRKTARLPADTITPSHARNQKGTMKIPNDEMDLDKVVETTGILPTQTDEVHDIEMIDMSPQPGKSLEQSVNAVSGQDAGQNKSRERPLQIPLRTDLNRLSPGDSSSDDTPIMGKRSLRKGHNRRLPRDSSSDDTPIMASRRKRRPTAPDAVIQTTERASNDAAEVEQPGLRKGPSLDTTVTDNAMEVDENASVGRPSSVSNVQDLSPLLHQPHNATPFAVMQPPTKTATDTGELELPKVAKSIRPNAAIANAVAQDGFEVPTFDANDDDIEKVLSALNVQTSMPTIQRSSRPITMLESHGIAAIIKKQVQENDSSQKLFLKAWPGLLKSTDIDEIDWPKQITTNIRRKDLFGKPPLYSRIKVFQPKPVVLPPGSPRPNRTTISPQKRNMYVDSGAVDDPFPWEQSESSTRLRDCDTIEKLFDLPDKPLPIVTPHGELAFRCGTRAADGSLPRAKEIYKTGFGI